MGGVHNGQGSDQHRTSEEIGEVIEELTYVPDKEKIAYTFKFVIRATAEDFPRIKFDLEQFVKGWD